MKWSSLGYCAAVAALTTLLVARGFTAWITVPLAVFGAYWTILCTRALWHVVSFQISVWRLHQAPSLQIDDCATPRTVKRWEWLSNPRLDGLIDVGTVLCVLVFPAVLWLPLILWLLLR